MEALLAALEESAVAEALSTSIWVYPLVNAAHILGIALLFGAIVPLDLRLIGLWPGASVAVLSRVLVPVAVTGLMLALSAGALLFITRASEYADSRLFLAKMLIVAGGLANALCLRWVFSGHSGEAIPLFARASAALSMLLWLGAIVLGRLVGYF